MKLHDIVRRAIVAECAKRPVPTVDSLTAAIKAAIQETHAIVPIEPTDKMLGHGCLAMVVKLETGRAEVDMIYKAMIEASPRYE